MSYLFSEYKIRNMKLKNRIVMSPMCMYSSDDTGEVKRWHQIHYASRAIGGAALIIQEATAVHKQGRISENDLGIWDDHHVKGLSELTEIVQSFGAKMGIQLAHAGRKADIRGPIYAASSIQYDENYKQPIELSIAEIKEIIEDFRLATIRAIKCNYDLIEIHAAHGYLINSFLSPISNKRNDEYGRDRENRFRFLKEIIINVRKEWEGPLFVRISANEYLEDGNDMNDFIYFAKEMKKLDVDLVDCSSGAVAPAKIDVYPGYQVKYAENIRDEAQIPTGAVGLITEAIQAEEVIANNRADLVFIGRAMLRDPYWTIKAARVLNEDIPLPKQYQRAYTKGRTSS